ncbi:unnamed protein product [Oikopleura dioica]|uniref:Uncharacterized protein n=1 Tax=Oikopleura dioica TaxID=34765 RepID=E4WRU7_OIKDI|nr:unnamed protein product [Oikopleura dioica]
MRLLPSITAGLCFGKGIDSFTCPDLEIEEICSAECRVVYVDCRNDCIDQSCDAKCSSEYTLCLNNCPCSINCPDGCTGCDYYLCENSTPSTATSTTTKNSPVHVQVIGDTFGYPRTSYIFGLEGFKENRCIETPPRGAGGHYYMDYAAVAVLKGEVMVFGGKSDFRKIASLNECSFEELPQRLQRGFQTETGSLVAFNEQNVLLCFADDTNNNMCEKYDAESETSSLSVSNSRYPHRTACLGHIDGSPVAVAGFGYSTFDRKKVEQLTNDAWLALPSHPKDVSAHSCLNLENGLLTIGGWLDVLVDQVKYSKEIYLLRKNSWTLVGTLQKASGGHSTIMVSSGEIINVSGVNSPFNIEKLKWDGDHVTSTEVLFENNFFIYRPVLYESYRNACSATCE